MVNLLTGNYDTIWTTVVIPSFLIVLVFAVKDVDTKEKIADLETKIVELEKQNAGLKNKVTKWVFWS